MKGGPLFAGALLLAAPAAPARELHWSAFSVQARLDAQGTLRIAETQTIVFTGDWNGGYRTFRLGPGQRLTLGEVSRIDPQGNATPLVKGDLDAVDHFDWTDASTIRWRSRLPSDPPFDRTAITYRLTYALSGVLRAQDGVYRLNHDFAFPYRDASIERFALDLELDPAWTAPAGFPTHLERSSLPAGTGVVVSGDLVHEGAVPAIAVHLMSTRAWNGLLLALFAFVLLLLFRFRQWEAASGRYRPLVPPSAITPAWLEENLFHWKAEEAGAAWDGQVGSPEVAAFLARLVAEGKVRSRVETEKTILSTTHVLHLELVAPRTDFQDHERKLVNMIFFHGNTTDTEAIRAAYQGKGFDPAAILREPLLARAAKGAGPKRLVPAWERLAPKVLGGIAVVSAAVAFRAGQNVAFTVICAVGVLFAILVARGIGAALSKGWQSQFGPGLDARLPLFLVPPALILALPVILARQHFRLPADSFLDPPLSIVLAIGSFGLAACVSWFQRLRSPDGAEVVERRRNLASARAFFEAELEKPAPALEDAWYPYVLAFGLDAKADRWFRTFGKASEAGALSTGGSSSSTSSSSSSSGGFSSGTSGWTGGGGSFGGAGASASWGVAAAGIAAGVAAPSSSSSGGGGGGGGSSSGGGGGGGW